MSFGNINIMQNARGMEVIKRDGSSQRVSFDKIFDRIEGIRRQAGLDRIDSFEITKETIQGLYNGITTEQLDLFAATQCANKIVDDPQYNWLAAGILVSNLHKTTSESFLEVTELLYNNSDKFGEHNPLVTKEYYDNVKNNLERIEAALDCKRDYDFDFFSIKTMEKAYLLRIKYGQLNISENMTDDEKDLLERCGKVVERPQHMFMRVGLGIHGQDIESAIQTYDLISKKYFTHASPTLYNAGSPRPQMSSCYLFAMDDSISDIFKTVGDMAQVSKFAGGIGVHLHALRAAGSLIRGTNGFSNGIVPWCRILNETGCAVNQGGRRKGAIACYLEPHHADIEEFIELRSNTGSENMKARDLFLAMWISDLFMQRVKNKEMWSLMCPDECPGLSDVYGDEFTELYEKYEAEGKYKKQMPAEELFFHILKCQIETGMPYMMFKDNVNRQTNQSNIGTIKSSNLCSEITQYSDKNETAVCNLASICLPTFVKINEVGKAYFDYNELHRITKIATKNLNKVIDLNFYPVPETRTSNMRHRPIGLGVQGLANTFIKLRVAFDSPDAGVVNRKIFETIYHACLEASCEVAQVDGPYETFQGSPFSQGKFQWHLWGLTQDDLLMDWDWDTLIENVKKYGTRNSLLTTIMPTASTSQLMTNVEACEPYTSNMYTRKTLAGNFTVVNTQLVEDLIDRGLWTNEIRQEFIYDNGSIQNIAEVPQDLKDLYKTAFEMKTSPVVKRAIERGPFIDQSQSMNLFSDNPDYTMLYKSHFYSWSKKLKTGLYYLRSRPASDALKFGLSPTAINRIEAKRNGTSVDDSQQHQQQQRPEPEQAVRSPVSASPQQPITNSRADNYQECEMCSG